MVGVTIALTLLLRNTLMFLPTFIIKILILKHI